MISTTTPQPALKLLNKAEPAPPTNSQLGTQVSSLVQFLQRHVINSCLKSATIFIDFSQ